MIKIMLKYIATTVFFTVAHGAEPTLNAEKVRELCSRVADWQINTYEEMGKYRALPSDESKRMKWHHRKRYASRVWNAAVLYNGLFDFNEISDNPTKYIGWLEQMGKAAKWKLGQHEQIHHADNHAVGQIYLKLRERYGFNKGDDGRIRNVKGTFDNILAEYEEGKNYWYWADALYMSPPTWVHLAKVTGEWKYLDYMNEQYRMAYNRLWNSEDQLFYRDASKKKNREENGTNEYWARGNGWVFAGLAEMLPNMPRDWKQRAFYLKLYQQMAAALKREQRSDGTWSMGIMGAEESYPVKETSGTTLFAYGLARGVNMGWLDFEEYEEVIVKAWNALAECVNQEGMVGYVQGVGGGPGEAIPNGTELYVTGAFLSAGAEVYKMYEEKPEVVTFQKEGGWCWFQDPRAIINNGKLIVGGISGVNGDIKVSVYDLEGGEDLGTVILDAKLERDDHNNPALYARPDGCIVAVWAKHATDNIHRYAISSPDNYLEWSEVRHYTHEYEKRGVTYMNLYYMEKEGLLYNFFRDGKHFNPCFITSSDKGETWGNLHHLIDDGVIKRRRPYARYSQRDGDTVSISFTDGHPRMVGNSIYYAELREGAFYNVDGSKIKELKDGPLLPSEAETIFRGSMATSRPLGYGGVPYSAWTCDIEINEKGLPYIGYTLYMSNKDNRFRMGHWNGSKWVDREIAQAGPGLYNWENNYTGLLALDPNDPERVYISSDVHPVSGVKEHTHEIYTAVVKEKDTIRTINWKPVTTNSEEKNIRPIVVVGEGYKVLLWMKGPWTSNRSWQSDTVGMVLERP